MFLRSCDAKASQAWDTLTGPVMGVTHAPGIHTKVKAGYANGYPDAVVQTPFGLFAPLKLGTQASAKSSIVVGRP